LTGGPRQRVETNVRTPATCLSPYLWPPLPETGQTILNYFWRNSCHRR
jgi:hypothetical protein